MKVNLLALEGVFDSGLSCLLDSLAFANNLAQRVDASLAAFDVQLVGMRRRVTTHHGMRIEVTLAQEARLPEVLIVPALFACDAEQLEQRLNSLQVRAAYKVIAEAVDRGVLVAAACTGSFVLAAAGCLDGKRATTAWWLSSRFKQLFPRVNLEINEMVIADGTVVTAGAALAHLDLALWLVRQRSALWADLTARYLVTDGRSSQAPYMIAAHLAHDDALVQRFERDVREHLDKPFSLRAAARRIGTSERSLQRRIQAALGLSPVALVQDIRVERAVHLVRTKKQSLDEIAEQVGYANTVTLRNLIRKKTGQSSLFLRHRP